MTGPGLDDRQDDQLGRPLLELPIEDPAIDRSHSHICYWQYQRLRKDGSAAGSLRSIGGEHSSSKVASGEPERRVRLQPDPGPNVVSGFSRTPVVEVLLRAERDDWIDAG